MALVDSLMEDDAERQRLRSKPTCFLVVGRPGVGKSTLAKEIADTWGCVLIDDTILLNFHTRTQTEDGIKLLNILNVGESVPEEMVLQLILDMLNSEKVHHYGYVLSCLPFISEESVEVDRQIELMKNLELKPDFIINIKCADKDLVQRLSGQKQHPETGLMYSQDKWKREGGFHVMEFLDKTEEDVEESEAEDEDEDEKGQTPKITVDQMVWVPEHNAKNTSLRINAYKDTILRPLEDYMMDHNPIYLLELDGNIKPKELLSFVLSRLGSMAIQRVSIPVVLYKDRELPEDIETEDLLRFMSSSRLMVPGCRWRRSRWGRSCPVALKEGRFIPGKPEYSVGFQDKLYILSSHEAFNKFMTNPRRYLLPPMPSPPCRVCIIGVLQSGRSALAKLMAERHNVSVLELEKLAEPLLAQLEQERLDKLRVKGLEAAIANIKLKQQSEEISDDTPVMEVTEDHPEVQALLQTTLDEAKTSRDTSMESLSLAVEKIITENEEANVDAKLGSGWVLDNFPRNISQLESLQQAGIYPDFLFCLMCSDGNKTGSADQLDKKEEKGPTDTEEQEAEKVQFMREWEGMQLSLKINRSVLETGNRSPEELLKEIVQLMEKPFKYVPREFSAVDQDEETEDMDALAEMDDDDNDDLSKESEDEKEDEESESSGDATSKRPFGDTFHFCPVVLQKQNTLIPCTDEIAGKYREKVYYFSSQDAREEFLLDPEQFVASTEILKPPAMRIFLLGCRGSGKTTQGQWLAKKLGLFHIQFREQLQLLLMAKTKQRVVSADESMEEHLQAAKDTLKEAVGEEDVETNKEVELTDEEISIKAYLTDGIPLGQHILEKVVSLYWKVEPYRSTGFILEGFPYNTEEVQHVLQHQLYPDVVVSLMAEVTDIQARLLPEYRRRWREHCDQREALFNIVREINRKAREESMVKRRAELMAEKLVASTDTAKFTCRDEDEEEDDSNMEDEIQAILEEEFPLDRDDEFIGDEETTEATDDRLSLEIEERYVSDTNNIASVMELLTELNIPRISINAGRKTALVRRQLLMKVEPLHTNRESLFQKCQPISYMLSQQLLLYSYKFHSAFGCLDPVKRYNEGDVFQPVQWPVDRAYPVLLNQYIYFLESKKNQQTFMLNPLKYLRQSKPSPTLPVKIAIIGPPKSGKTGDVCPKVRPGPAVHRWCHASSS